MPRFSITGEIPRDTSEVAESRDRADPYFTEKMKVFVYRLCDWLMGLMSREVSLDHDRYD
jgi:hypothetical protein